MFEIRQILGATASKARAPAGARVKRRAWLALGMLTLLAQAGCGQKGPLYLPKDSDKAKKHEPRKTEEGTIEK